MRVRFWGTRGSIPVAMTSAEVQRKLVTALVAAVGRGLDTAGKARAFVENELDFSVAHTFGGNSSCVQLEPDGSDYVLCDLGSGARAFGNSLLATRGPAGHRFHVFMSHLHWDHIMGFPFFMPAYLPGNHVTIYGCPDTLEEAFRGIVVVRGTEPMPVREQLPLTLPAQAAAQLARQQQAAVQPPPGTTAPGA